MRYKYPIRWLGIFLWLMCCLASSCHSAWAQDTSAETPPANSNPGNNTGNIVDDVIKQFDNKDGSSTAVIQGNTAPNAQPDTNAPGAPPPGIPGIVAAGDNATLPQVPEPPRTFIDHQTVILRALDKVTARTKTLEVPVGQQFNFGALTIAVRACRARPALEPADAAAFLQIVEQKPGEPMTALFSGWMFASAPSLSALEHPVYDVWVVGCGGEEIAKPTAPATPSPAATAPTK